MGTATGGKLADRKRFVFAEINKAYTEIQFSQGSKDIPGYDEDLRADKENGMIGIFQRVYNAWNIWEPLDAGPGPEGGGVK